MATQTQKTFEIPSSLKKPIASLRDHFLLLSRRGKKTNRLVGIASVRGGEGTTTIAANLALSLSKFRDAKILLVDANLTNPTLHKIFKIPQSPGLVEGMEKGQYKIYSISPSLSLLPAGKPTPDYIPPYETTAFLAAINDFKKQYTFTIFDIAPFFEGGEGLRLVAILDYAIMVIQEQKTKWEEARRLKDSILRAGTSSFGIVENKNLFLPQP